MMTRSLLPFALLMASALSVFSADDAKPTSITQQIAKGAVLTVLEGLPHQVWEKEALAAELKSKETVQVHDFPFYKKPLELTAQEVENLRLVFASTDTYAPHSGEKRCGGFHPDYALSWKSGTSAPIQILVCFGCNELRVVSENQPAQRYDIGAVAGQKLAVGLQFRSQRPAKKSR